MTPLTNNNTFHLKGGFKMSQAARDLKVKHLLEKKMFNEMETAEMTDSQIEYYHWLYFEDSVYDYM
jgi:hypothetical protein